MKIQMELEGDLRCWVIRVAGKEFKSESSSRESLKKLWASVLDANIFVGPDEEQDIYNEDSEYPCSIADVVWTQHCLRQDGYSFAMDY